MLWKSSLSQSRNSGSSSQSARNANILWVRLLPSTSSQYLICIDVYHRPELDIWCTGLTLLSLLTGRKYPIGTTHKELPIMAQAVTECLQEADGIISERGRRSGDDWEFKRDWQDWQYISEAVESFLDIDGERRMQAFERYRVGRFWLNETVPLPPGKDCMY